MKKFLLVFGIILWGFSRAMAADGCQVGPDGFLSTSTTTTTNQSQMMGDMANYQGITFNSPGESKSTIRSHVTAYPGGDFMMAPAIPYREAKIEIIQPVAFYVPEQRYSFDILQKKLAEKLDLIQVSWNIYLPPNLGRLYTLPGLLGGPDDILLGSIQIQGPINGFDEETLKIARSVAAYYGAHRTCIKKEMDSNPWNASNGTGSAANYSGMDGDSSYAGAVSPRNGKAQAREYKIPIITLYCYGPGWVPTPRGLLIPVSQQISENTSEQKQSALEISIINGRLDSEATKKVADLVYKNWQTLRGKKIQVVGFGPEGTTATMDNNAFAAMGVIGEYLISKGIAKTEVISTFSSTTMKAETSKIMIRVQ